jgi:hypothetical protein
MAPSLVVYYYRCKYFCISTTSRSISFMRDDLDSLDHQLADPVVRILLCCADVE